ncbi:MAG: alcohol dehydrogenase catalytic domain-containing protein [Myxococcota bacterium]|nr:alcohol dehydrogenase catalytic domain-containing protein [Myxococcota bacterium]
MRALVYENSLPRLAATKILSTLSPRAFVGPLAPIRLRELPEPARPAPDWVTVGTSLCGLCGSDAKQVFMNGDLDNPMTSVISFPQVLGHEVVGRIESVGSAVDPRRVGQRVLLDPWLSCVVRGLPPCAWCERGERAQCENFTRGSIAPGIHHGNSRDATGGFAERLPAHESQCIPIPDDVSDEAAVLGDPFAVSLHAILHWPPPPGGTVLVYGCGTLGLLAVAILRALLPRVRVLTVTRYPHQARLAEKLGAERCLPHRPERELIASVGGAVGAELREPWRGLPMLNGGVDVVYDTVTSPETLEVGVRVTKSRGSIVALGVEPPRRFEWTPLYFKEISLVGSNAFAIEEWEGRRQHAMEWYLELVRDRHVDVTPIITHRFALDDYRDAFMACFDQGRSGAVKVLFDRF